jgi:hypothetical protein
LAVIALMVRASPTTLACREPSGAHRDRTIRGRRIRSRRRLTASPPLPRRARERNERHGWSSLLGVRPTIVRLARFRA